MRNLETRKNSASNRNLNSIEDREETSEEIQDVNTKITESTNKLNDLTPGTLAHKTETVVFKKLEARKAQLELESEIGSEQVSVMSLYRLRRNELLLGEAKDLEASALAQKAILYQNP